jgi:hypothetical protein
MKSLIRLIILGMAFPAAVFAQSAAKPQPLAQGEARYANSASSSDAFPRLFYTRRDGPAPLAWARNENEPEGRAAEEPLLLNNQVIAYYGKPGADNMGILGRYSKEEIARQLDSLAVEYDRVNGQAGVKKAFYLIYGTVWPGGDIGIMPDRIVSEYVEYAQSKGMLVFLDHQIGRFTVEEAMNRLLPWLRYPNVHLALDPEWRTAKPMKEIGSVSADEINRAQVMLQAYLERNSLPGSRMLVIHQFKWFMIADREKVQANFDRVLLVHCADGFGSPSLKIKSYRSNAEALNIPLKSFKLFYKSEYPKAGFDEPLLTPEEVCAMDPFPSLVMYQ